MYLTHLTSKGEVFIFWTRGNSVMFDISDFGLTKQGEFVDMLPVKSNPGEIDQGSSSIAGL